jgi:hypothetical protein
MTHRKAITLTLPHIAAAEEGKTATIVAIEQTIIDAINNRVDNATTVVGNIIKAPGRIMEKLF